MSPTVAEAIESINTTENAITALARPKENLSGARKAAILCLALGDEAAAQIFKYLSEDEVQLLSKELALLEKVEANTARGVVEEFHQLFVSRSQVETGGMNFAKRLLNKAFAPEVARRVTENVQRSVESTAVFEQLQKFDPQQLAKLFQSEHAQTIAVVLAHLEPAIAAHVLQNLPASTRGDVVLRMANLQTVSQDVVRGIAAMLEQKFASFANARRSSVGGVRTVAEICNRLDREINAKLLEELDGQNPDLSGEIRNLMFTFEDIAAIDDIGIREILQRVDKKALALALKGTSDKLQERFFSNMSSRAVEMMREEMDFMGQVKKGDVTGAQREIVSLVRELETAGTISISGGGADEYVG